MCERVVRVVIRVSELTTAALLALMTILVVLQVFCRYVLHSPLIWAEEAARLAMIWLGFLGASVALWRGRHIRIEGLVEMLPSALGRFVQRTIDSLVLFLLGVMSVQSCILVLSTRQQTTAALQLPVSYAYYLAICLGMVLMTCYQVMRMVRGWRPGTNQGAQIAGEAR